jgi:hypothetical protein
MNNLSVFEKSEVHMKKLMFGLFLTVGLLLTAGCGGTASETSSGGGSSTLSTSYPDAISVEEQLIFGTIKLDGTDLAVDAEQAQDLLPLWQTLRSLQGSDTAAQQEIDATLDQIQETMTPDQIQAIQDFQLTQENIADIMQSQGMNIFGGQGQGNNNGGTQSFSGGGFNGGGPQFDGGGPAGGGSPPEGGFVVNGGPGGGEGGGFAGGTGGQGNLNKEQIATLQAGRGQNGGSRMTTGMANLVIRYLQGVINPETVATPPAPSS